VNEPGAPHAPLGVLSELAKGRVYVWGSRRVGGWVPARCGHPRPRFYTPR